MAKTLVPPVKSMDLNLNVKIFHAILMKMTQMINLCP